MVRLFWKPSIKLISILSEKELTVVIILLNWSIILPPGNFFIIKKLDGDPDFDVVGSINFTKIDHPTPKDWEAAKQRLQSIHDELMDKLKYTEDSVLLEGVPGRSYNFFYLLTGIVNHSLYHLGQIQLLMKL